MSRRPKTRWVVVVTDLDAGPNAVLGPWLSKDKAQAVADRIVAKSSHYGCQEDNAPALEVETTTLDPWPGLKRFMAGDL
jgi:hypothetical protein